MEKSLRYLFCINRKDSVEIGCIEVLSEQEALNYIFETYPNIKVEDISMYEVCEDIANHIGNDYLIELAKASYLSVVKDYCYDKDNIFFSHP